MKLWFDLETFSDVPISFGVYRYAEKARILLCAYAVDDAPARCVDCAALEPMPADFTAALKNPACEIWAHNSNFDRNILARYPGCEAAARDISRWRDSMIAARALGLPGALLDLCGVCRIPADEAKDKDGRQLVNLFCKRRPDGQIADRNSHPAEWDRFRGYCRLDVEAMRAVYKALPYKVIAPSIWKEWHLDQKINDRGMAIDTALVSAAVAASEAAQENGDAAVCRLTGGRVQTVGQLDALIAFLLERFGYSVPDLQKSTLENRLNDPACPDEVRELLSIRLSCSKASVKKFKVLENSTGPDGRLRGCLQFFGAVRTGRWAGRLFQPQNLPRGSLTPPEVEEAISALKSGIAPVIYDDVNAVVSSCLRGAIIAPPGKKLVVADLSNIEGRVLAWLAGENWKLDAFRAYDAGTGPDLYKATYARTFSMSPADVTKKQRQIGKVMELGLGYQGGVGAFVNFARVYGLDLDDLAAHVAAAVPEADMAAARARYDWMMKKPGAVSDLSPDVWAACDVIKTSWRAAHPAVTGFWDSCAAAVADVLSGRAAIGYAGKRIRFGRVGTYLACYLPSSRVMMYPAAELCGPGDSALFRYYGPLPASKRWGWLRTYAGKIAENITQAVARDVLAANMGRIDDAGYQIVLSVHDELITETPDSPEFSEGVLSGMMATAPAWADGLPLSAAGFSGYRYRKD